MKISLDTNILYQEGYTSQNMQVLARLADAGLVQLYIADLVLREHDSRRTLDTSSKAQSISQNLKDIKKIFSKSGISTDKLDQIESSIIEIERDAKEAIHASTGTWLKTLKATNLHFSIGLYQKLWDDYFVGCGAFKKPKNRDDIPDAVIGLCIIELAKKETMVVICKDGQLKSHLANTENLSLHDDLASFIASHEVQTLLQKLDSLNMNIETIKNIIDSSRFRHSILGYISAHESDLYYACWKDDDIENTNLLPIPLLGGIRVDGPLINTISQVEFGSVSCIESKHFVMPIEFIADMPISYASSYLDWVHLPTNKRDAIEFESMDGDGIGEVTISKNARVTGQVVIYFLEEMTAESVQAHSEFIGHENCKLDVEYIPGKIFLT